MCGGRRRRQQRGIVAVALLAAFREYQSRKALPSTVTASSGFQEPMITGVAYRAPEYSEAVNPHPPNYDEVADETSYPTLADEKSRIYRSSMDAPAPVPPHVNSDAGAATVSRSDPNRGNLEHLLAAIKMFFDTQIKLNEGNPGKIRHLESKRAKKLAKAERKFAEYSAKGKDYRCDAKMAKRAEKMEKWTEWAIERCLDRDAYAGHGRRSGCHGPAHQGVGHMEQHYRPTMV